MDTQKNRLNEMVHFNWDGPFEHSVHISKLMDKKIIIILHWNILLYWTYGTLFWIHQVLSLKTDL